MIKLKDILKEIGNIRTSVPEAGQLWPFSKTTAWAKHWEEKRMSALLKKSLEGMIQINSICDDSTIEDKITTQRAGSSKQNWAGTYKSPKLLKGWKLVDNLKYDKTYVVAKNEKEFKHYTTSKHPHADDDPLELPSNGLVHTKKWKKK